MKALLYILSSMVLALTGALAIVRAGDNIILMSIGTSVTAGGIAALAFATIRVLDDIESKRARLRVESVLASLGQQLETVNASLFRLSVAELGHGTADERCIFERHITDQFTEVVSCVPEQHPIEVDVVGFSLARFFTEQFILLASRPRTSLRIIVQDPQSPAFDLMARHESRAPDLMRQQVAAVTRDFFKLAGVSKPRRWRLFSQSAAQSPRIEFRWFQHPATITMTRINEVIFVRPRAMNEGADAPVIFERYAGGMTKVVKIYREQFEMMWKVGRVPTLLDLERLL